MADDIHVLCVDDESLMLELGRQFLEETGDFSVDTADSAPAALDLLSQKTYDAIVSDYLMPEMDGIELLKRVRAVDKNIPFILFTGRGQEDVVIEALNNGATFYLQKREAPDILYRGLIHIIRQAVLMRRAQVTLADQEQRIHDLQNAGDLIQSVAPDGHFLFVNKKWLDTLGYREDEVSDLTIFDVIHQDSMQHCRETFRRVIAGENVGIIDAVFRTRDGERVYVEGIASCKLAEGKCQYTRGIFRDVTDRKKAEQELLRKNEELHNTCVNLSATEQELRGNYEELRRKELELSASESRYRTLFENMLDGFAYCRMLYDENGNPDDFIYLQTNRAFSRLTGLDNVTGKRVTETFPGIKEMNPEIFEIYGRVASTGTPEIFEICFGPLAKWLHVSVYSPEKEHFAAIFEDFTERKTAEEALRESEEMLALVMNGIPTMISYMDTGLRFVYLNKAHAAWYGRTEEALKGRSLKELLPEEVFLRALPQFRKVLRGEEAVFENLTRDAKGHERVLGVRLVPHIRDGQVVGFFSALNDITESKRMEEALRESEARFHSMFEHHDSIMLLIEPETGKILDANLSAERFYGRSRSDLQSLSIQDINALSPEEVAAERAKAAQGTVTFFTFPHRVASGEIRTVDVHTSPIAMNGRPILFSIINDITERRQAEEALHQANKKLNLLSGITRHDINNQLMVLNGFVALLQKKIPDPSYDDYFSRITQASDQISAMIRFTKEYEKIGVHAPVWQDLPALAENAGKNVLPGTVTFKNELPANSEVFADPLIVKVFFNLIDNALRHGGKITTIRFFLESREGDRIIVCEDDGNGVRGEEKEKIFTRGFGKNTGFGLALSREILDITGITITESGEPGKGARFEIRVPQTQFRSITR